ncbi:MAG: MarR family winged helix-turn-helix transcriptional regulator [Mycobacteriales bacterium]
MESLVRERLETTLHEAMRIQTMRTVLFTQAIASRLGMNPIDLQCLNLLVLHGPVTPSRLAEAMSMTKGGAITAVIDRLEKAGYLQRRRDTQDRRQVLLYASEGEPMQRLLVHFTPIGEAVTALLADYTDDQLRLITEFITGANDVVHRLRQVDNASALPSPLAAES